MAGNELIVDDDYCKQMGNYFVEQGEQLDGYISAYISILKRVRQSAIKNGEVADALAAYITQAEKMNNQMRAISRSAKTYTDRFVAQIDEADKFLF